MLQINVKQYMHMIYTVRKDKVIYLFLSYKK